ncbi:hypothetical protein HEP81_01518 [Streptomyces griseofuscus]|uniref:Uncharacterized protein n=1 Tax=Streptomyces griseofuscus TaxID=146922 RepID=A0A7H1PUW7_9ACTN|nr:hypothetical protein HEP81_01518 [Streptomyces griseofuscus]
MGSALRKRPFRPACAAASSASAPQCPEPDPTTLAQMSRTSRPLTGSGR